MLGNGMTMGTMKKVEPSSYTIQPTCTNKNCNAETVKHAVKKTKQDLTTSSQFCRMVDWCVTRISKICFPLLYYLFCDQIGKDGCDKKPSTCTNQEPDCIYIANKGVTTW